MPLPLDEPLERRMFLHAGHALHEEVNFQTTDAPVPDGYIADTGFAYGLRPNGRTYGWSAEDYDAARDRADADVSDVRRRSFAHLQPGGVDRTWEIALPKGWYLVSITAGDAEYTDSIHKIDAEGVRVMNFVPGSEQRWAQADAVVFVADGRLTVTPGEGASNAKISHVEILATDAPGAGDNKASIDRGDWTPIASMPVPRTEAQQAVKDGLLYVFGGYDRKWSAMRRVDVYVPAQDAWIRLPDMPRGITHAPTVVDGNNVILVGGYAGDNPSPSIRDVWMFNVKNKRWTPLPPLPQPRAGGGAGIVGTTLYFYGGSERPPGTEDDLDKANTWALDLANLSEGWNARARMPSPRNHLGYATLDGKVYAIGGQKGDREATGNQASVHAYDPAADAWRSVASLPYALGHIGSGPIVHNGKIVLVGGITNVFTNTDAILTYDPAQNRWERAGTVFGDRKSVLAMVHDKEIYVVGGGNHTAVETGYKAPFAG